MVWLPTSAYAHDKRADIRVAFGSRLAIPVEIKKSSYSDVWRAVDEQLVAKYTRAPEPEATASIWASGPGRTT